MPPRRKHFAEDFNCRHYRRAFRLSRGTRASCMASPRRVVASARPRPSTSRGARGTPRRGSLSPPRQPPSGSRRGSAAAPVACSPLERAVLPSTPCRQTRGPVRPALRRHPHRTAARRPRHAARARGSAATKKRGGGRGRAVASHPHRPLICSNDWPGPGISPTSKAYKAHVHVEGSSNLIAYTHVGRLRRL